jgi:hypothetical protein
VPLLKGKLGECEALVCSRENILFKDVLRSVEVVDDIRKASDGYVVARHYNVKIFFILKARLNRGIALHGMK